MQSLRDTWPCGGGRFSSSLNVGRVVYFWLLCRADKAGDVEEERLVSVVDVDESEWWTLINPGAGDDEDDEKGDGTCWLLFTFALRRKLLPRHS